MIGKKWLVLVIILHNFITANPDTNADNAEIDIVELYEKINNQIIHPWGYDPHIISESPLISHIKEYILKRIDEGNIYTGHPYKPLKDVMK